MLNWLPHVNYKHDTFKEVHLSWVENDTKHFLVRLVGWLVGRGSTTYYVVNESFTSHNRIYGHVLPSCVVVVNVT